MSLVHEALNLTKVQANASKHKSMSHERMLKAEAQLEKEFRELMRMRTKTASTAMASWEVICLRNCDVEPRN